MTPEDRQRWDAIYERLISPRLFETAVATTAPRALLVGGQPGAGKSRAIDALRPPGSVAVVGDDLRIFHPDYHRLMKTDHLAMPDATAAASGYWVGRAIDEAAERGVSVVVEGTFRRPETTLGTARDLHTHGFEVDVVAVAVRPEVSRLGTVTRYLEQDHPRWTPHAAHEAALEGLPATLQACEAELGQTVASVRVVDRDAVVLYDATDGLGGGGARETLAAVHARALGPTPAQQWLQSWAAAENEMDARGLRNETTRPTLDRLAFDAVTVRTFASEPGARLARAEDLRDHLAARDQPSRRVSFHEQSITDPGPHQTRSHGRKLD